MNAAASLKLAALVTLDDLLDHFRGMNAAASLKRRLGQKRDYSRRLAFRGMNAAASLKRLDELDRHPFRDDHFRGMNAAASLKPFGVSAADLAVELTSAA